MKIGKITVAMDGRIQIENIELSAPEIGELKHLIDTIGEEVRKTFEEKP